MAIIDTHMHMNGNTENGFMYDAEQLIETKLIDKSWLIFNNGLKVNVNAKKEDYLKVAKTFPDVFMPIIRINFTEPLSYLEELKAEGWAGLKAIFPPKPYDDESFFPYYEKAQELGMLFIFHAAGAAGGGRTALNYGGIKPEERGGRFMHVYHLDIIAKLFPGLIMVAAHMGAPWYDEAWNVVGNHPNVYCDISDGFLPGHIDKAITAIHNPKLEDKLMFGVDGPVHGLKQEAEFVHFWQVFLRENVNNDVYEKIMGGNAQKVMDLIGYK